MRHFVTLVQHGDQQKELTSVATSVHSHLMAFAAEQSRLERRVIAMKDFSLRQITSTQEQRAALLAFLNTKQHQFSLLSPPAPRSEQTLVDVSDQEEEISSPEDEIGHFPTLLLDLGFLPPQPSPVEFPTGQLSTNQSAQLQREPVVSSLVAAQVETPHLFGGEHPGEAETPKEDANQMFFYGNPFDGVLPDVFQHDEDLKRSLKEQSAWLASRARPAST